MLIQRVRQPLASCLVVHKFLRCGAGLALCALAHAALAQPTAPLVRSYNGPGAQGWAVASIADLDGDGYRDFIVGARGSRVDVYSSASSERLWFANPGILRFGYSVSATSDINGDGYADVISGSPLAPGGGEVRVLSGVDGSVLLAPPRPNGASRFGNAVGSMDDINGDGIGELLVGDSGGRGIVYVLSGADGHVLRTHFGNPGSPGSELGAGVAGLQDIDGDGVSDYVAGAPGESRAYAYSGADGGLLHSLRPQSDGGRYGEFFVADAGDVNADGTTDIYVGSYAENGGNGAAYVYSGVNGSLIRRIAGGPGEGLGPGRSAGDVDGDGHADIIAGSYTASSGAFNQNGSAAIYSGSNFSILTRVVGDAENGQLGFDALGVGDVTGDGRLDFVVSSPPTSSVNLYAGVVSRSAVPANATLNHSDTYWESSAPGWGLNVLHQGDLVFATWYSYAPEDGAAMFLTVEAPLQADGSFAGAVFRVAGTPLEQINGTQAFTSATQVGTAQLQFGAGGLNFDYEVYGATQSKQLQPFRFAATAPTCFGSNSDRMSATNYSDLWWNPLESGWGLTLAHQGDAIFLLWYTYGAAGRDQWFSGSRLERQADGSFVGALEQPLSGTPLADINGPATSFPIPELGSASLRFSDGENAIFRYSVNGIEQSKRIKRFVVVAGNQAKPTCVATP